ncbi:hypothetical protein pb186bvf_000159 [Paramecium bursaria]
MIKEYEIIKELSEGSYGKVYLAKKEDKIVAMKEIKLQQIYTHELQICQMLKRHQNIVDIIDFFNQDDKNYIVLEFCDMSLSDYLQQNPQLTELDKIKICAQIGSAFKSIYESMKAAELYFQHRDIKPANIMLAKGIIKLIDFGESRLIDEDQQFPTFKMASCGTANYQDPLMKFCSEGFSSKSDIWSLGCTFFEILIGSQSGFYQNLNQPIINKMMKENKGQTKQEVIQNHINKIISSKQLSPFVHILISKMLTVNIENRYSWEDLFKDEYFRQLIDEQNELHVEGIEAKVIRKKPIKLTNMIKSDFVSLNFKQAAGPIFTERYYNIITYGQFSVITAQKLLDQFKNQREENESFSKNWQLFEKLHYLLTLKSLVIFHNYNTIMALKQQSHGAERIEDEIWVDLIDEKNKEIYERVHLQVFHSYDNLRKQMQGSQLEERILKLRKDPAKYGQVLVIPKDEEMYFSYGRNNHQLDQYNNSGLNDLISKLSLECIELLFQSPTLQNLLLISDLFVSLKLEILYKFNIKDSSITKHQNYQALSSNSQDLLYGKLRIIYNSITEDQ